MLFYYIHVCFFFFCKWVFHQRLIFQALYWLLSAFSALYSAFSSPDRRGGWVAFNGTRQRLLLRFFLMHLCCSFLAVRITWAGPVWCFFAAHSGEQNQSKTERQLWDWRLNWYHPRVSWNKSSLSKTGLHFFPLLPYDCHQIRTISINNR